MYEMEGSEVKDASSSGMYEVPEEMFDKSHKKEETSFEKPPIDSAVLSPSSVVHKSSPAVVLRQTALNPTTVETDKDTQKLVEEEDNE